MRLRHVVHYPGESLSSWLVRSSLFYGCDPLTLASCIWGNWRPWTRDIDRGLSPEHLDEMVKWSGLATVDITAMTLSSRTRCIIDSSRSRLTGNTDWILPLSIRNRTCLNGYQYCPLCLEDPESSFFTLDWRFSFSTACLHHTCLYRRTCPHCHVPVQFPRVSARHPGIAYCFNCDRALYEATAQLLPESALRFQTMALQAAERGQAISGTRRLTSQEWFSLCSYYIQLLRLASGRHEGRLARMLSGLGSQIPAGRTSLVPFEQLSAEDRLCYFEAILPLLEHGLTSLPGLARESNLSRNALLNSRLCPPEILATLLTSLPERHITHQTRAHPCALAPHSKRSVLRHLERLLRKVNDEQHKH